ncbi:MAG TPA: hypothetical protein VFX49_22855 [Chloroflexota bacterium]|nr:hypothetical protein [Chloroflexota bacterium]
MQISRLPQPLVKHEHGMLKDHVVVINEDGVQPLAWRVNASFAGFLAGAMADLVESPAAIELLERRLGADRLMPESQTLFRDMVRTARRKSELRVG